MTRAVIHWFLLFLTISAFIPTVSAQKYDTTLYEIYVIKGGDNLTKIAKKHNTTVEKICELNNISAEGTLKIGKELIVRAKQPPKTDLKTDDNQVFTVKLQTSSAEQKKWRNSNRNSSKRKHKENVDSSSITNQNQGSGGRNSNHKPNLGVVSGILLLILAAFFKYSNRIKMPRKNTVLWIVFVVGLFCFLLAWKITRIIAVILAFLIVLAIILNKKDLLSLQFLNRKDVQANIPKEEGSTATQQPSGSEKQMSELSRLRQENQRLEQENVYLRNELENAKKKLVVLRQKLGDTQTQTKKILQNDDIAIKKTTEESTNNNILYAVSIYDGRLTRVKKQPTDDSVFEIHLDGEDCGTLTIMRSAHGRIIANPAYIEGCDRQYIGRSEVHVTPGEAVRNNVGEWIVTKKPIVIIR